MLFNLLSILSLFFSVYLRLEMRANTHTKKKKWKDKKKKDLYLMLPFNIGEDYAY